jgi:hypothetical protein
MTASPTVASSSEVSGAQYQGLHRSAFRFGGGYARDASRAGIRDIDFGVNQDMRLKTLVSANRDD